MTRSDYDPDYVRALFDADPEREWLRMVQSPAAEIGLHIHNHYLREHITPGSRVLEIGSGPGRFTTTLHALGCRVVVADISPAQLDLHRQKSQELGFAESVEAWRELDICDLSPVESRSFDAVIAYGGPLSYVFDRASDAIAECRRVLRGDGVLLASVMSLWGTLHYYYRVVMGEYPRKSTRAIVASGDLTPENDPSSRHFCHLYRGSELVDLLQACSLQVIALSASNSLSSLHDDWLSEVRDDPEVWREILAHEVEASASPGFVDAGSHLIAVARRNADQRQA